MLAFQRIAGLYDRQITYNMGICLRERLKRNIEALD